MIQNKFDEISLSDIKMLTENKVRENRTLEYKLDLPHKGESGKIPFLAELSAFANTIGGDLIFGIEENAGVPISIPGISSDDIDKEILRLENYIRTGIEPRISKVDIKPILIDKDRYLIIVRVKRSWNAPHRVISNSQFYGRNSAGKYPLDVTELRIAFILSQDISSRLRQFRKDRINSIFVYDELPVDLVQGGRIALHIFPLSAFMLKPLNVIPDLKNPCEMAPLGISGCGFKYNIDGVVTYSTKHRSLSSIAYCQLYRSGIIETVLVFERKTGEEGILHGEWYEKKLLEFVKSYLSMASRIGIDPPFYIFLSLIEMKGYYLSASNVLYSGESLDKDIAMLPEGVIENISDDPKELLRPIFDMVLNAFGHKRA